MIIQIYWLTSRVLRNKRPRGIFSIDFYFFAVLGGNFNWSNNSCPIKRNIWQKFWNKVWVDNSRQIIFYVCSKLRSYLGSQWTKFRKTSFISSFKCFAAWTARVVISPWSVWGWEGTLCWSEARAPWDKSWYFLTDLYTSLNFFLIFIVFTSFCTILFQSPSLPPTCAPKEST